MIRIMERGARKRAYAMEEKIEDGRVVDRIDLVPAPVIPGAVADGPLGLDGGSGGSEGGGGTARDRPRDDARPECSEDEHPRRLRFALLPTLIASVVAGAEDEHSTRLSTRVNSTFLKTLFSVYIYSPSVIIQRYSHHTNHLRSLIAIDR